MAPRPELCQGAPIVALPNQTPSPTPPLRHTKRGFFLRGLAVVLPAMLTVFVFVSVAQFVQRYVAGPVNQSIYAALESNRAGWEILSWVGIHPHEPRFLLSQEDQCEPVALLWQQYGGPSQAPFLDALELYRQDHQGFVRDLHTHGIDPSLLRSSVEDQVGIWAGVLIAAALILVVGYLTSGFLGRALISGINRALSRLPLVRSVYPHAKQLVDFFLSDKEMEFDAVVAAPYPSPGIWSIGLVTGKGLAVLDQATGQEMIAVYIPSSPLPMTGYTVFIPAKDLTPLDLTVEEAFRLVVSVGVLTPEGQAAHHPAAGPSARKD